jgi:MFS family permease
MSQPNASITLEADSNEPIYRRNFFFFTFDGILFMTALSIIGSTTVIPDFVRQLTSSEILIGLSANLFDIGFTLPQLFIARFIIQFERKKWWFIGPSIPVRTIMLIFGMIVMFLGADNPGLILGVFFFCYGLVAFGDGMVGASWADLVGTSLNSRWRARMFGMMSTIVGLIMLALAPLIRLILSDEGPGFPQNYGLLFIGAGVLFAVSIIPIIFVKELPGGKAVEKLPSFREFLPGLVRILRVDAPFRSLIVARILVSFFIMANPFYIGFATTTLGLSSTDAVPNLLAMQTIGAIVGAMVYTWLGAKDNLLYIRLSLGGAAILPVGALLSPVMGPVALYVGFFMSGLCVSNLGLSYINWVITHASPDQRPIYAGLFNTIVALTALLAPFLGGTIATIVGYQVLFVIALVMVIWALVAMLILPKAEVGTASS